MSEPTPPSLGGPYGAEGDSPDPADKLHLKASIAWVVGAVSALLTYAEGMASYARELVAAEVTARNAAIASSLPRGPFAGDAAAAAATPTVDIGKSYFDSTGAVKVRMV